MRPFWGRRRAAFISVEDLNDNVVAFLLVPTILESGYCSAHRIRADIAFYLGIVIESDFLHVFQFA